MLLFCFSISKSIFMGVISLELYITIVWYLEHLLFFSILPEEQSKLGRRFAEGCVTNRSKARMQMLCVCPFMDSTVISSVLLLSRVRVTAPTQEVIARFISIFIASMPTADSIKLSYIGYLFG